MKFSELGNFSTDVSQPAKVALKKKGEFSMKSLELPVSATVCNIYAWVISPGRVVWRLVFRSSSSTCFLSLPNSRPPVVASVKHSVVEFVMAYIGKSNHASSTSDKINYQWISTSLYYWFFSFCVPTLKVYSKMCCSFRIT